MASLLGMLFVPWYQQHRCCHCNWSF